MRHLVYEPGLGLAWREAPDPVLGGPGDALVRPVAVAACDLDVAVFSGDFPVDRAFPVGHEFVGEVVDVADGVTSVRPGDMVACSFQISCGSCSSCRVGLTGSCRTAGPGAMFGFEPLGGAWGGALADLLRVPFADAMLTRLPEGVHPVDVASLSDNVADGWRTVAEPLARRPGAPVLVVGGRGVAIPLYAVQAALALGAERVDYVDHDEHRLERAAALGARPVTWTGERVGSYPITVDAAGLPERLRFAVESTAAGGVCTSAGIYFEDVAFPMLRMYTVGVTFVTGRVHSAAALPGLLQRVAAADLRPGAVTEHVLDWEDAPALLDVRAKAVVVRGRS